MHLVTHTHTHTHTHLLATAQHRPKRYAKLCFPSAVHRLEPPLGEKAATSATSRRPLGTDDVRTRAQRSQVRLRLPEAGRDEMRGDFIWVCRREIGSPCAQSLEL